MMGKLIYIQCILGIFLFLNIIGMGMALEDNENKAFIALVVTTVMFAVAFYFSFELKGYIG